MKKVGFDLDLEEWVGICWVGMGVERPLQVWRKAGEEGKDELDLGSSEFARAWIGRGRRPGLDTPGCHPRTLDDSCTTVFLMLCYKHRSSSLAPANVVGTEQILSWRSWKSLEGFHHIISSCLGSSLHSLSVGKCTCWWWSWEGREHSAPM